MASTSEATPEKPKKTSDKDVDLSNRTRGIWLVKVPKYISERWQHCAGPQQEVGKLKIARNPGEKPLVTLNLDDKICEDKPDQAMLDQKKAIPKEHKLVINAMQVQTLAVFSHTSGNSQAEPPVPDRLALEGKINQRADCRPINNMMYMNLKKDSIRRAIEPQRMAKQIVRPVNTYKPVANHAANKAYEFARKNAGKKSRDDKEAVMEKLFALFEKHQYYNIKDLVRATNQPVTYLKEILNEVCKYNLKQPHKNMWELKPEYRHYKSEEPAEEGKDDDSDESMEDAS